MAVRAIAKVLFVHSLFLAMATEPSCSVDSDGKTICQDSIAMLQSRSQVSVAGSTKAAPVVDSTPVEATTLPLYKAVCPSTVPACSGPVVTEVLPLPVYKVLDTPAQIASVTLESDWFIKRPKDISIFVKPVGEDWKFSTNAVFPGMIPGTNQVNMSACGADGAGTCTAQTKSLFKIPLDSADKVEAVQAKIITEWGTGAGNYALILSSMEVELMPVVPEWILAAVNEDCISACTKVGGTCDLGKLQSITTSDAMITAATAAGKNCSRTMAWTYFFSPSFQPWDRTCTYGMGGAWAMFDGTRKCGSDDATMAGRSYDTFGNQRFCPCSVA